MKSQYPKHARQVAARAFSRGWMSVRGHRDAHSEISIGRKTPTPHILDGWKKLLLFVVRNVRGSRGYRRHHRLGTRTTTDTASSSLCVCCHRAAETTDRTRLSTHREVSTLRYCTANKHGRTYVTSWSCLLHSCCRSRWWWPSCIWRTAHPPPVKRMRLRSKKTWLRIKVSFDDHQLNLPAPSFTNPSTHATTYSIMVSCALPMIIL